jgi:hypothetical protein
MPEFLRVHLDKAQIINRSIHGKPVFPMTMRNAPRRRGRTASLKEINESGVREKPTSLKREAGVNIPLVGD